MTGTNLGRAVGTGPRISIPTDPTRRAYKKKGTAVTDALKKKKRPAARKKVTLKTRGTVATGPRKGLSVRSRTRTPARTFRAGKR